MVPPQDVGDDSALMIPSQAKMGELDEAWAAALSEAEQRARLAGRKDVAEYLSLRNSNDLIRTAGVDWLITVFTTLAGDANRGGDRLVEVGVEPFHAAVTRRRKCLQRIGETVRRRWR